MLAYSLCRFALIRLDLYQVLGAGRGLTGTYDIFKPPKNALAPLDSGTVATSMFRGHTSVGMAARNFDQLWGRARRNESRSAIIWNLSGRMPSSLAGLMVKEH